MGKIIDALTQPQPDPTRLQFVRSAVEGEGVDMRDSLWRDPITGEEGWLDPARVMAYGLTDRMREALVQEAVPEPREDTPEATSTPVKPDAPTGGIEVLGGHTDAWRWQRVVDGDEILWCIDNKPAVQAASHSLDAIPEYQRVVVPEEILREIVR